VPARSSYIRSGAAIPSNPRPSDSVARSRRTARAGSRAFPHRVLAARAVLVEGGEALASRTGSRPAVRRVPLEGDVKCLGEPEELECQARSSGSWSTTLAVGLAPALSRRRRSIGSARGRSRGRSRSPSKDSMRSQSKDVVAQAAPSRGRRTSRRRCRSSRRGTRARRRRSWRRARGARRPARTTASSKRSVASGSRPRESSRLVVLAEDAAERHVRQTTLSGTQPAARLGTPSRSAGTAARRRRSRAGRSQVGDRSGRAARSVAA